MLENILGRVRRGAGRVQRRGEEVAQGARLRVEIFGLTRELDTLYARLGRSYHAGAEPDVLGGIREEIRRVDEEIQARERLLEELNAEPESEEGDTSAPAERPAPASAILASTPGMEPTVSDATPRPAATAPGGHEEGSGPTRDPTPPGQ